jgi:hypothetical protein
MKVFAPSLHFRAKWRAMLRRRQKIERGHALCSRASSYLNQKPSHSFLSVGTLEEEV